jgi:hypothetical protein
MAQTRLHQQPSITANIEWEKTTTDRLPHQILRASSSIVPQNRLRSLCPLAANQIDLLGRATQRCQICDLETIDLEPIVLTARVVLMINFQIVAEILIY